MNTFKENSCLHCKWAYLNASERALIRLTSEWPEEVIECLYIYDGSRNIYRRKEYYVGFDNINLDCAEFKGCDHG